MIPDGFGEVGRGDTLVVWSAIAMIISLHLKAKNIPLKNTSNQYSNKMQQVVDWLNDNLESNANLNEIATRFGFSRTLLTREFRRYSGTSVGDYLNTRRLQKSASLLASTEQSITEIVYESGFSSVANFYRRFKNLYGVTPVEFRTQVTGVSR